MKDETKVERLLACGLDSRLAEKAVSKGYSLTSLKNAPKKRLAHDFYSQEVDEIQQAVTREPIPIETLMQLLRNSELKCCICWDVREELPVIIHHIEEYSKTHDNSYDNLIVLCLNHHAVAHSSWAISQHPLPPQLLRVRKAAWTEALTEYRKGMRPAPGIESEPNDAFRQSDCETILRLRAFFDRPALHDPFRCEGNMGRFQTAVTDIIRALNAGVLLTAEGVEIGRTKPRGMISNPNWVERLALIAGRVEELRTRFLIAVRGNEMTLREDGFYCFQNRELPDEIDAMRDAIIILFNGLLIDANLPPITGVRQMPGHIHG